MIDPSTFGNLVREYGGYIGIIKVVYDILEKKYKLGGKVFQRIKTVITERKKSIPQKNIIPIEEYLSVVLSDKADIVVDKITISLKPKGVLLLQGIYYDKDQRTIYINPEENEELSQILVTSGPHIYDPDFIFSGISSSIKIEKLYSYDPKYDMEILEYYKGKIPETDWEALRVALIIRQLFYEYKDKDISTLKSDLIRKYGQRGKNIANYCTSGYFHTYLKEVYENSGENVFKEIYEALIGKNILAVFVHKDMSIDDILSELKNNVKKTFTYGIWIGEYHIHGIGSENIKKIYEVLQEPFVKEHFKESKIILVNDYIIIVKLYPNRDKIQVWLQSN